MITSITYVVSTDDLHLNTHASSPFPPRSTLQYGRADTASATGVMSRHSISSRCRVAKGRHSISSGCRVASMLSQHPPPPNNHTHKGPLGRKGSPPPRPLFVSLKFVYRCVCHQQPTLPVFAHCNTHASSFLPPRNTPQCGSADTASTAGAMSRPYSANITTAPSPKTPLGKPPPPPPRASGPLGASFATGTVSIPPAGSISSISSMSSTHTHPRSWAPTDY